VESTGLCPPRAGVDWSTVFPADSPFALYYSLQVVANFAIQPEQPLPVKLAKAKVAPVIVPALAPAPAPKAGEKRGRADEGPETPTSVTGTTGVVNATDEPAVVGLEAVAEGGEPASGAGADDGNDAHMLARDLSLEIESIERERRH